MNHDDDEVRAFHFSQADYEVLKAHLEGINRRILRQESGSPKGLSDQESGSDASGEGSVERQFAD